MKLRVDALAAKEASLSTKVSQTEQRLEKALFEKRELEATAAKLREEARQSAAAAADELAIAKKQSEELAAEKATLKRTLSTSSYASAEGAFHTLEIEAKLAEVETTRAELEAALGERSAHLANVEATVAERNVEIASLREELAAARAASTAAPEPASTHRMKIASSSLISARASEAYQR